MDKGKREARQKTKQHKIRKEKNEDSHTNVHRGATQCPSGLEFSKNLREAKICRGITIVDIKFRWNGRGEQIGREDK